MGNGAKAASKRERQKDSGPVAKSQLKSVRFLFSPLRKRATFASLPFGERKSTLCLPRRLTTHTEPRGQEHQVQDLLPGLPVDGQAPCAGRARQQQAQQEVRGLLPCCCLSGAFEASIIIRG